MSTALYELAEMRDTLDAWLLETDGELTPELESLLNELDGQADEKIERVALYIREQLAQAKAIKEEEERLCARRKARERAAESLKSYLAANMERLGKSKVTGLLCTVAMQNNPPSLVGELAPEVLVTLGKQEQSPLVRYVPESFALDRRACLDLAKSGGELPAGLAVVQSQSLRIR